MGDFKYQDMVYRAIGWGEKNLPPLDRRIDQAAVIFLARMQEIPNVVLLREADYAEAEKSYRVSLPNGRVAHIAVELSPIPGKSHDMLIGKREVTQA